MESFQIIVIGAGAAGLVVAKGCARLGKKVLLIEKGVWGGDCTNYGCIPSKSLIASAACAQSLKESLTLGVALQGVSLTSESTRGVFSRLASIVSNFRKEEEPEALSEEHVTCLEGTASFVDSHSLQVTCKGETTLVRGDQIVLACGSKPYLPPIVGLDEVPYWTSETVFSIEEVPKSLLVVGGGPIGCELSQSFARLGTKVKLVHTHSHLLLREERKAQEMVEKVLRKEGVELFLHRKPHAVFFEEGQITLEISPKESEEKLQALQADALLLATGRRASLEGLELKLAGVEVGKEGVITDRFGRTTQKHIFAIGDVRGPPFFTHRAEADARAVLFSLQLPYFPKRLPTEPMPRVTFTDPEVASFGLREEEAKKKFGERSVISYRLPWSALDRAITDGREEGYIEVVTKKWSSQIVGATIVGVKAGEILSLLLLAAQEKIPLKRLSKVIFPYPTYGQSVRKLADQWLTKTVFSYFKWLFRK